MTVCGAETIGNRRRPERTWGDNLLADHLEFFRQFRHRFETTGAVAPSSRFLARAMLGPLRDKTGPRRVLEVGPGTGAVTRFLVQQLQPDDRLDLVELNESFASLLRARFDNDPRYRAAASQSRVHVCPLQEFEAEAPYDCIISGLPLNNFPVELVRRIFESYDRLLAPGGTLSYFEYMYVRPLRSLVSSRPEKMRLRALDRIMNTRLERDRFDRSWVFVNLPPAWVQHLRKADH